MRSLAVFAALVTMFSVSVAKDELQVGDLVKKNLESIGTDSARAAVKSRVTQGPARLVYLTGPAGTLDGKQVVASEGNKMVVLLKLLNPKYHGERFVSDGQRTSVAQVSPGVCWEEPSPPVGHWPTLMNATLSCDMRDSKRSVESICIVWTTRPLSTRIWRLNCTLSQALSATF
jgi:hypothetical protein